MAAEARLTPAAEQDLAGIWRFTQQQWDVEQVHRTIDALTAGFITLAMPPKTAPACDHIRAGYRCRSVERHVVYFKIAPDGVPVVRVLHERMDAIRRL